MSAIEGGAEVDLRLIEVRFGPTTNSGRLSAKQRGQTLLTSSVKLN